MESSTEVKRYITSNPKWGGAMPEKRRSPWRYDEETGKYDNRPIDTEYFKKYMSVRVQCPCCSKMVARGDLAKHKKRPICMNNKK